MFKNYILSIVPKACCGRGYSTITTDMLAVYNKNIFCTSLSAIKIDCFKTFFKYRKQFIHITSCLNIVSTRRGEKFTKFNRKELKVAPSDVVEVKNQDNVDIEGQYEEFLRRSFRITDMGHHVFVIQPYIKWGVKKKRLTTPQLQLDEACTLVKTLERWTVVEKAVVPLDNFDRKTVFGEGNLEKFKKTIQENKHISAVFLSIDVLQSNQHRILETVFGVPVYDRYSIVIQIFREHATTKEAKLQIQMAEIPYLMSKMRTSEESFSDVRQNILKTRETKIKKELVKLKEHRQLLRLKRNKCEFPLVAVVGYTNAGKTSLIKALTGETDLQPHDRLFATLDVTLHAGFLPSRLKVLYVDTVGFISDIPTTLIESFVATLEDAMIADVIVHIIDVSHPDLKAQVEEVKDTLERLEMPEPMEKNIIVAGNKIDLISKEQCEEINREYSEDNIVFISADRGIGTDILRQKIEEAILTITDRIVVVMRVLSGREEFNWLYRECTVSEVIEDPDDNQYVYMKIIISQSKLAQFKHYFIKNYKRS